MECLCPIVLLFMLLTVGYHQFITQHFGWVFGIENQNGYDDDPYGTLLPGEDLDPIHLEEFWEDKGHKGTPGPKRRVNLRARLDQIPPGAPYQVAHDISFVAVGEREPRKIDHLVLSPLGVFLIRTIDRDGMVDTWCDSDEWFWMDDTEDMNDEVFPSPRHDIKRIARQFAEIHAINPDKVIGVVASIGRSYFEGQQPPDVRYAKDLPKELWPLSRQKLTPREFKHFQKWLARGAK